MLSFGHMEVFSCLPPILHLQLSASVRSRSIFIIPAGTNEGTIQLRSTSPDKTHDMVMKGWNGLAGTDWSPSGNSLLVACHNHDRESALLKVALAKFRFCSVPAITSRMQSRHLMGDHWPYRRSIRPKMCGRQRISDKFSAIRSL